VALVAVLMPLQRRIVSTTVDDSDAIDTSGWLEARHDQPTLGASAVNQLLGGETGPRA
jgi:hypothetical protein